MHNERSQTRSTQRPTKNDTGMQLESFQMRANSLLQRVASTSAS